MPETLYLCVNILDRFLSKSNFEVATKDKLKLLGLASLLLASKYEQRDAVGVYGIEYIAENIRVNCLSDEDKMVENMAYFFSGVILGRYPFWSNELKMCTGYSEEKLFCCVK
ncbi:cyclin B1, partial [Trifolium pratense]